MRSFSSLKAQDSSSRNAEEIDPAKPTNFHTQVSVAAKFSFGKADELMGTPISGKYTFNPNNLILVGLPLLYNLDGKAGGLDDIRLRNFGIIKKDYSKKSLMQVTPIYAINDLSQGDDGFTVEFKFSHLPTTTSKIQVFVREVFTHSQTTVNTGYTLFF